MYGGIRSDCQHLLSMNKIGKTQKITTTHSLRENFFLGTATKMLLGKEPLAKTIHLNNANCVLEQRF